ncbi:hypothetical protein [[Pseudomonas] boreopolis]|uniref:hypothetical protein n=1 Tax=Xanthomonas boreopolis TaxID=86183 RepID=UPI003D387436
MQQILEHLKNGNPEITQFFVEAEELWTTLLADIDAVSITDLAERLHVKQPAFERICDDRHLGKILMAWSAFPHFYSCEVGFDENGKRAHKLMQAFANSFCSVEVKHAAKDAAEMYGVADYA